MLCLASWVEDKLFEIVRDTVYLYVTTCNKPTLQSLSYCDFCMHAAPFNYNRAVDDVNSRGGAAQISADCYSLDLADA